MNDGRGSLESGSVQSAEIVPVPVAAQEEIPTADAVLNIIILPYSWPEQTPERRRTKHRFHRRRLRYR